MNHIHDLIGVRIVCSFLSDVYDIVNLIKDSNKYIIKEENDYIKNPKKSGYRSLHLIVEVPIFLKNEKRYIKVEVQLRTIAMDFWASLEHKLRYKKNIDSKQAELLEQELVECAEISAALDKRMEEIRNRIEQK